jgi:hypothetical protein
MLWNHFFYPYIVSLIVLRKFCRYFIGITEKACRVAAFLSWYRKTALPQVRFALTLHAWIDCLLFSTHVFFFFFFRKKKGI